MPAERLVIHQIDGRNLINWWMFRKKRKEIIRTIYLELSRCNDLINNVVFFGKDP